MQKTLINELKEKDIQAELMSYTLNDFYWPTLFPLVFTPTMKWESLQGELGAPVAGDVVSWDSRAPRKTRNVISKLTGDVPKISVGRDMTETDLNKLALLRYYAGTDQGAKALIDFIYEDPEFVWTGVNARLEWLALRAASTAKIKLTNTNNEGVVTENNVDFLVPTSQKKGVAKAFSDPTSDPIAEFRAIKKAAKGYKLPFAYTEPTVVETLLDHPKVKEYVAPWLLRAVNIEDRPNLTLLNKALANDGLSQIAVIDAEITIEIKGEKTVVNPFEEGVMTFVPALKLGKTFWGPLAENLVTSSKAIRIYREHFMMKKFSTEEPLTESTIGMSNSFPALGNANRTWMLDTKNTTWNK
ncbi:major capsid protein [Pedobacter panaciterrae]